jgi:diguanylate cyclase (GGDEF)-like protein
MKIPYGKSRLYLYLAGGAFAGTAFVAFHEMLGAITPRYHLLALTPFIALVALIAALVARSENQEHEKTSRLDAARERIGELMQGAISERTRGTVLVDESLCTCYDELGCDKEDCPAYGVRNARCWLIAGTFCRGKVQGQFAKKLKDCRLCEVYKKATSDPVDEITETFYAMNYLLSEREEQLERAFEQARVRSEKLAGLVSLSEAALSSVHLSDLLRNLLESAGALVGADVGFVSLVDPGGEQLLPRVSIGIPPGAAPQLITPVGKDLIGRAFAGRFIAISQDLPGDENQKNPYLKNMGAKTLISLPLFTGEEPVGMLTLGTLSPHEYSEEEKDSLSVASGRIAVAIENARLAGEIGRDREQTELVEAITTEVGSGDGMSAFYDSFVQHASRLIDFDQTSMSLWHPETGDMEIVAVKTSAPRSWLAKGVVLPRESLAAGALVESKRPLIRPEIESGEFPTDKLMLEEGIHSTALFPLLRRGELLGVIQLGSFKPDAFKSEDVELLEPVIRQLGLVVDNILMLQEAQRSSLVDQLTGLYSHRFFFDALNREIAVGKRYNRPVSLMLVRLNGLSALRLRYGQKEADGLLQKAATILSASLRAMDIISRYSGSEFSVVLPELASSDSGEAGVSVNGVAMRVKDAVEKDILNAGKWPESPLSISIGIAAFPAQGQTAEDVLEKASRALVDARAQGGNSVALA